MVDSPWDFARASTAMGGEDAVTLVEGPTFMLSGASGDVHPGGVAGLFMLDTRVLSRWELAVNGHAVEPLSVTHDGPFGATFVGRVGLDDHVDAAVAVVQRRYVGRGVREEVEVRHHGAESVVLTLSLTADADFRNVFAVKAGHGTPAVPRRVIVTPASLAFEPESVDATPVDRTVIQSFPAPDRIDHEGQLEWRVRLEPGERLDLCLEVSIEAGGSEVEPLTRCGTEIVHAVPVARLRDWRHSTSRIVCDDPALTRAIDRAIDDLGALRIFDPEHPERTVVAAGAPWFMTLFGRDSLLTSWMALLVDHDLALGVLAELADAQGAHHDPRSEEQPGRILHEVRFDRLSARLLGGNGRYYGSVDATPLFVMLAAEVVRWLGPDDRIAALMPAIDRAMEWIGRDGDRDGDGFVEYLRSDVHGLEHQGWKDSWDGIRHLDGSVAEPPIALCEVQGYVYAAYRARAVLARAFGQPEGVAREYDQKAENLREHFEQAFWLPEHSYFAVGLDANKAPIGSLASNLGHLLWTGIVAGSYADELAQRLAGPSLFNGWGIRTLASDAVGYNPLSYHCGSVWPHDTAIAVAGLSTYGFDEAAGTVASGLIDAASCFGGRLPELFAGFDRSDVPAPAPYPASCSPQAWAAASPLFIVRSLLGLQPDAVAGKLRLRPRLPDSFGRVQVTGLPIGSATVDICVDDGVADVEVTSGDLEVKVT